MYVGEDKLINFLSQKGKATLEEIAAATSLHIDSVRRIVEDLKTRGYVSIEQSENEKYKHTPELSSYIQSRNFPEFSIFTKATEAQKAGTVLDILQLNQQEKQFGLRWAKIKGLVTTEGGKLMPVKTPADAADLNKKMLLAADHFVSGGELKDKVLLDEFFTRKFLLKSSAKSISVSYTGKVYSAAEGFDVTVESKDAEVGRSHPVTKMTDRIKKIFAELGFEEMDGDIVESTFWNFDALFQPQDHPARELADTFYLKGSTPLPDSLLVNKVKKAHESGWGYKWNEDEAKRTVLRTHTTAVSARYVAALKDNTPKKYFMIGRVFRNEATDYKHLAEFHQVEGIIIWKDATFRDLLGILKEFYRKLGFDKVRFRPSFFPYTEPSLEVEIFYEPKKEWLEIGGAGIFRPEVSIPLANTYPVLAWGLSLERPLMIEHDIKDMRTIYKNDLDFLRGARI